jgi:hypothetical protein
MYFWKSTGSQPLNFFLALPITGIGTKLLSVDTGSTMDFRIPLNHYSRLLAGQSNNSLSLDVMFRPFGLDFSALCSTTLLVGHVLDALHENFPPNHPLDALDVASTCWELGHEDAGIFLDVGPDLVFSKLKKYFNIPILN